MPPEEDEQGEEEVEKVGNEDDDDGDDDGDDDDDGDGAFQGGQRGRRRGEEKRDGSRKSEGETSLENFNAFCITSHSMLIFQESNIPKYLPMQKSLLQASQQGGSVHMSEDTKSMQKSLRSLENGDVEEGFEFLEQERDKEEVFFLVDLFFTLSFS